MSGHDILRFATEEKTGNWGSVVLGKAERE